jgi:large subunit ribosomal protein L17
MRHRKARGKLGRNASHRVALIANLLAALITHERIKTTRAKAKVLKPIADNMMTLAKRGNLHARRQALQVVRDKKAVKKLFDTIGKRSSMRNGGYTRIYQLPPRRGDCAPMALIEWVDRSETK